MAKNGRKMSDEQLLALVAQLEKSALGSPVSSGASVGGIYSSDSSQMTTLEVDRYNALNYYFARPFGNEVDNQSQYVSPDLRDTVDWMMPQLMRIFGATDTPAAFDPEGSDDTDQAALETAAVNHVFMRLNPGFFILHDFIKDALLLRNGYVKTYLEEKKHAKTERYSGLTEIELTMLLDEGGDDVEVIEQNERQIQNPMDQEMFMQMPGGPQPQPQPGQPAQQGQPGQPQQAPATPQPSGGITVFDVVLRRKRTEKTITVECAPPEEILVSPETGTEMDKSPFVCHKTTKPRSDLIDEGYDADDVNAAEAGRPGWMDIDALARNVVTDQFSVDDNQAADRSMQMVEVRDVVMRLDWDDDGIAELRHILIVGDKVLENEEMEESMYSSGVPWRMPHRHTGISMYDLLADIQLLKSQLTREGLTNLRLANAGRVAVDWRNCNLSDLLNVRAGGVVRTNGNPASVLMPLQHPTNLIEQVIPMIEYADKWRQFRTGVGEQTVGLDADALQNQTKGAVLAGLEAASLKIELVARCLAEGVKDIFLKIHALMIRHQDQDMQFQMAGKWVTVNPSSWRPRTRVAVNVGLGTGTRETQRANLAMVGTMQEKLAAFQLVGPKQAYETFKEGMRILGYDRPERFAMDPSSAEYQQYQQQHPPQQAPVVQAAQMRAHAAQAQAQASVQKANAEVQAAQAKGQREMLHDAVQQHEDRQVQMSQQDMQMVIAFIRALGPIVAAQLKQDPNVDAGQVLRRDLSSAEGQ